MFEIEPETLAEFGEKLPVLYRYIPTTYINDFFRDGSLMLTTYERCKVHEDKKRRDVNDGKRNYLLTHAEIAVAGIESVGRRSYLLCTSMIAGVDHFDDNSYFAINDPLAFASAIARSVPAFRSGRLGKCQYRADPSLSRESERPVMPDPSELFAARDQKATELAFEKMRQAMADSIGKELGAETYFVKAEVPFKKDAEFRFIFTVENEVSGPLVIPRSEAHKFCARSYG
jgi:hypothetical protein